MTRRMQQFVFDGYRTAGFSTIRQFDLMQGNVIGSSRIGNHVHAVFKLVSQPAEMFIAP